MSGSRVVVVALALLAAGCGGGGGTLSASALSKESDSLRSLAAEGALLASDAHAGRTTQVYTRVHSEELAQKADQAGRSLVKSTTTAPNRRKLRQLTFLSGEIEADLKRLGHASKPEQRALARELGRAARLLK